MKNVSSKNHSLGIITKVTEFKNVFKATLTISFLKMYLTEFSMLLSA